MVDKHSFTLGDLIGKLEMLEVRCSRCDRTGRLRLTRLIEEHGAEMCLPPLRRNLAANCPKKNKAQLWDECDIHYPQLIQLFRKPDPPAP